MYTENDLPAKSTRLMVDCIDVFSLLLFCVKVTDTIVCARLLNNSQHSPI